MRAFAPARIGADFTRLWTASAVSNIGDGVTMAAGPLLVASVTTDPALIAGAVFVQQLPWLLLSLVSGAYVDRLDRRQLIVVVNLLRGGALAALTTTVLSDTATVPVIYAVFFVLGTCETLADTAFGALLPAVVAPEHLASANARLSATFTVVNQFAAKPFGAWLFVVAAAAPFGLNALTFAVGAALVARVRPVPAPATRPPARLRTEIADGVRWLCRHPVLRTLAVSMGLANVAFCAAFAVFVLYTHQRLGLSDIGYGFLLTTFAVGGLIGAGLADGLQKTFGATAVLRAGLIVEVITHATLAATTAPLVAATVLVIFGTHTMVWGVIVVTLRQRDVPPHLLGRVGSVYALVDVGGAALGSLLGGLLSSVWEVTTPFWAAAAAMAGITTVAWRPLRHATTA